MKQEQKDLKLWRKVQVDKCIKVVLIFIGTLLMQFLAYLICVPMYMTSHWTRIVHEVTQEGRVTAGTEEIVDYMMSTGMQDMLTSESGMVIMISMISAFLCMIWCGFLYYKSDWREKPFSYRKAFSKENILGIVGLGFGGCVVLTILLAVLRAIFPQAFEAYMKLMENVDLDRGILTWLYVLLIGPVSEELIFRGAITDRLKIAFPFGVANLLQAALFGLYHGNLIQGLYAFGLGMILGLVLKVTGSIWGAVLTHILFNCTNYMLNSIFVNNSQETAIGLLIVFALAVVSFGWGLRHYIKSYEKEPTIDN